jgi:hypothetical protein
MDGTWGPVRWLTVETDGRGMARLDEIAPGTYRVLRRFRRRNATGYLQPDPGRWKNNPVIIQVQAGKTVTLPPLQQTP